MGIWNRKGDSSSRRARRDRAFRAGVEALTARELLSGIPVVIGAGQLSAGKVTYTLKADGTFWESAGGAPLSVQKDVTSAAERGGFVYELQRDGELLQTPIGTTKSTVVAGHVGQIAVDGGGNLSTLNAVDRHVYRLAGGTTWQDIQPYDAYSRIAVDASGSLFGLSSIDAHVYRYSGSGTAGQDIQPYDIYSQIGVDAAGILYGLSATSHQVSRYNGGTSWQVVQPYDIYSQIGVDAAGSLYALSITDRHVYRYSGSGTVWQNVSPYDAYGQIGVDAAGVLFGLSATSHQVSRYDGGTAWEDVSPYDRYSQIGVDSAGSLYGLSSISHQVSRYSGGVMWTDVSPYDQYSRIAVDTGGSVYGLSLISHQVSRYAGGVMWTGVSPYDRYSQIGTDAAGSLYGLSLTSHQVSRYSGGVMWTDVSPYDAYSQIGVDSAGSLYGLSSISHQVSRYAGGVIWQIASPNDTFSQIGVDAAGIISGTGLFNHQTYHFTGTTWQTNPPVPYLMFGNWDKSRGTPSWQMTNGGGLVYLLGIGEPDAKVYVKVDGVVYATTSGAPLSGGAAKGLGAFTVTLINPRAGTHTATVWTVDADGNTSPISAPTTFNVLAPKPVPPPPPPPSPSSSNDYIYIRFNEMGYEQEDAHSEFLSNGGAGMQPAAWWFVRDADHQISGLWMQFAPSQKAAYDAEVSLLESSENPYSTPEVDSAGNVVYRDGWINQIYTVHQNSRPSGSPFSDDI